MTEDRRATPDRRPWPRAINERRAADRLWYTPQEVGNLTGFSADFILREIHDKQLPAVYVQPAGRKRGRWRILIADARAYVRRIGLSTSS